MEMPPDYNTAVSEKLATRTAEAVSPCIAGSVQQTMDRPRYNSEGAVGPWLAPFASEWINDTSPVSELIHNPGTDHEVSRPVDQRCGQGLGCSRCFQSDDSVDNDESSDYVLVSADDVDPPKSPSTPIEQAARPSEPDHGRYSKQRSNLARRRETSMYNWMFGVLCVSWTKSDSNPQDAQYDRRAQEIVFRPYSNRYLSRGFSLLCERSFGAWKISLRCITNFTINGQFYRCCALGDLSGIQRLLGEGKASPSDVTPQGYTPLHVRKLFLSFGSDRGL